MYSERFYDLTSDTKMVSYVMQRFENLLKEISLNTNEKNEFLEIEFNEWKGNFFQVDDLLII